MPSVIESQLQREFDARLEEARRNPMVRNSFITGSTSVHSGNLPPAAPENPSQPLSTPSLSTPPQQPAPSTLPDLAKLRQRVEEASLRNTEGQPMGASRLSEILNGAPL